MNRIKRRMYFLGALLVLCLMNGLCLFELNQYRVHLLEDVANQEMEYLLLMIHQAETAKQPEEVMMEVFDTIFQTNSRSFGFVVMDDELIYYRDDGSLRQAQELKTNRIELFVPAVHETYVTLTLANNLEYILVSKEVDLNGHTYVLGILKEETYVLDNAQFLSYARHTMLFAGLSSIVVSIFLWQMARNLQQRDQEIIEWQNTEKTNRQQIEQLLQNLKVTQKTHIEDTIFGFMEKDRFVKLITKLNEEQQRKSQLIRIYVMREDPAISMYLAAILQRMDVLKCVSCEWHPNEFCVLVLNADALQVENTLRYIITIYHRDYHGNLNDLKLVTQQVRRKSDGISTI